MAGDGEGSALVVGEGDDARVYHQTSGIRVPAGTLVSHRTAGGGGYGDPFSRDPEAVARDVRNQLLSAEQAAEQYGVAIDPVTATVDLRSDRAAAECVEVTDPAHQKRPGLIGKRIPRVEDARFLQGRATYVADVRLPGMLEIAFVRSQMPHAMIESIDTSEAAAAEGVVRVVTSEDLTDVSPVPDFPDWARPVATFPLCRDRVRYVGAPLAAVVATDRYLAEDAAELVYADLDPLPAAASVDAALAPDAPILYDGWPDNKVVDFQAENAAADEAFERLRMVGESSRSAGTPRRRWSAAGWRRSTATAG